MGDTLSQGRRDGEEFGIVLEAPKKAELSAGPESTLYHLRRSTKVILNATLAKQ